MYLEALMVAKNGTSLVLVLTLLHTLQLTRHRRQLSI